ncbi:MAG TPA: hypothetical protein VHM91_09575 [Verrucomicrobiales bacterium]|nr:hypothetical protein [Verrucomicrobiales bacterium]
MKATLEKMPTGKKKVLPGAFDPDFWRDRFPSEPYTVDTDRFEDYEPAYRLGYNLQSVIGDFDLHEPDIRERWESAKGNSRLSWDVAKEAVRSAWMDNSTMPRDESNPSSSD